MSDTQTPPDVGSLWEHESGERRFVMGCGEQNVYFSLVRWDSAITFHSGDDLESHADWLSWQAEADRIDSERPQCAHEYDRSVQLLSYPAQYRCVTCGHTEFCHVVDGTPDPRNEYRHAVDRGDA